MSATHPGLVVQDSQQVHGIILILLSQRAAVKKQKDIFIFRFSSFGFWTTGKIPLPVSRDGEDVGVFAVALPDELDHFLARVLVQFQGGQRHLRERKGILITCRETPVVRSLCGHKEEDAQLRMDVIVFMFNVLYVNGIQMKGATTPHEQCLQF